jgi:hypothetical protein
VIDIMWAAQFGGLHVGHYQTRTGSFEPIFLSQTHFEFAACIDFLSECEEIYRRGRPTARWTKFNDQQIHKHREKVQHLSSLFCGRIHTPTRKSEWLYLSAGLLNRATMHVGCSQARTFAYFVDLVGFLNILSKAGTAGLRFD